VIRVSFETTGPARLAARLKSAILRESNFQAAANRPLLNASAPGNMN
jgi:hypothetical protein